jgi:hypothetical protein
MSMESTTWHTAIIHQERVMSHEVMSQFFYLQVPYSSVIRSVVTFTKVRMLGWMLLGVLGC